MAVAELDAEPSRGRSRRAVIRLLVFGLVLAALFVAVAVFRIIDVVALRDWVRSWGAFAPLAYWVLSSSLPLIFVPGPLLAAGAGVLFGPVAGTLITVASATTTAVVASVVGRKAGREGARELLGDERSRWLDGWVRRNGLWAVVGQRFIPGVSDAGAAYAFGALGVPMWQMAAGALIGSAPRAFVYSVAGASIAEMSLPWAIAAGAVWCVVAIVGVVIGARGFRALRMHRSATALRTK